MKDFLMFSGHSIILCLLTSSLLIAQYKPHYKIIWVGDYTKRGYAINDSSEVVGLYNSKPYVWKSGVLTSYATNGKSCTVRDINNNTQLAGDMSVTVSGVTRRLPTIWTSPTTYNIIGIPSNFNQTYGNKINNSNVFVGWITKLLTDTIRGFIYDNGLTILPDPVGCFTKLWDINETGTVLGSRRCNAGNWDEFTLSNGITTYYNQYEVNGINNTGMMAGWSNTSPYQAVRVVNNIPYFFNNGIYGGTWAYIINDFATMLGEVNLSGINYPAVFIDTTVFNLNAFIPSDSNIVFNRWLDINNKGEILVNGYNPPLTNYWNTYLLVPDIKIVRPKKGEVIISGIRDSIMWEGGKLGQRVDILLSTNAGATWEPNKIAVNILIDSGKFYWDVPEYLLTRKAYIKLVEHISGDSIVQCDTFRIKPWIITRVDVNGDYIAYDINFDRWNFFNDGNQMWPQSHWQDFNYRGIDPFTGRTYSQVAGFGAFYFAKNSDFPDWASFVNTFGINACYWNTTDGRYKHLPVLYWWLNKQGWEGSCFGIAQANALAFQKKLEFQARYPNFPSFINPIQVGDDYTVRKVITELFTHQFGNPHKSYRRIAKDKTPNESLNELKSMLRMDTVIIKTLALESNNGLDPGAHTIIGYKLIQDELNKNIYHLYVYDNALFVPSNLDEITIDTSAFNGRGRWDYNLSNNWGGGYWLYLIDPAEDYLTNPQFWWSNNLKTANFISSNDIQLYNPYKSDINICNSLGQHIGYYNDSLMNNIPGAYPYFPLINSYTRPHGYNVPSNNYSIVMNNFADSSNNTRMYLMAGNKVYAYSRGEVIQNQMDRLFFDGSLYVTNPDLQSKIVELSGIMNESTDEKLFTLRNLNLVQNDSVKIENPTNDELKLINFGSSKSYELELNYASTNSFGRFLNTGIIISQNTTHQIFPIWDSLYASPVKILIDFGNNGTIDDSIIINNLVPVELSSFTASVIGSNIELKWRTETEVDNYGFAVERASGSSVATNWLRVGFVEGHGNSNSPKDYSFTDSKLQPGKYFYRLKQIDSDGTYEYSDIIEVNLIAPKNYELHQNYPNPFNASTLISFDLPKENKIILGIYNLLGELVDVVVSDVLPAGYYKYEYDASNLSSGVYLYKLQCSDYTDVKKMVIVK